MAFMRDEGIQMKDLGDTRKGIKFVNVHITQTEDLGQVTLSQKDYAESVVKEHGIENSKSKDTPFGEPNYLSDKELKPCSKEDHALYRSILGSVMYLMVMTRPDLSHACSFLSRVLSAPLTWHLTSLFRMLRYIKGTADRCIVYGGAFSYPEGVKEDELLAYVDSSFEVSSITGYVVMFNGGPIVWKSSKQKLTALSTAESELVAASDVTKSILALRLTLRDIGQEQVRPTVIFEDNQAVIHFAHNENSPSRMKHIDLRKHFVQDYQRNGDIRLVFISSNVNVADMFTKPLAAGVFIKHRDLLVTKNPEVVRVFPGFVPKLKSEGGIHEERDDMIAYLLMELEATVGGRAGVGDCDG